MKRSIYFLSAACFLPLMQISTPGFARKKNNHQLYKDYYTGCWRTDTIADGFLTTYADQRFQWIKPGATNGQTDTLLGTWQVKAMYSIPFKITVIALRYKNGSKKKYEVNPASVPAIIYLPNGHKFHKVTCD